jgi:iron complex transport system substrate-binding protein
MSQDDRDGRPADAAPALKVGGGASMPAEGDGAGLSPCRGRRHGDRALRRLLALAAGLALLGAQSVDAASPPRRIVSLNPCLDAILLDVADPGQIAALSRYSGDPAEFALADKARGFRHIHGDAGEIAALRPDLVLYSGMGAMELSAVLPRLKIASASFAVPATIAESFAQVRRVAALTGHPDRGEALVRRIDAALQAAAPAPGEPRLSAVVFEYRGQVSGPHTLMDELMRRAGFVNAAPRYGLSRTADLPLERLVADPPQVLLSGSLQPGEPSWGDRVLSHPVLASLRSRMREESFPEPLLFCAGPVLIPASAALAHARRDADGWAR